MIDLSAIDWRRDRRMKDADVYIVLPDDEKNRVNTFMSGWQAYLDDPGSIATDITWKNLGSSNNGGGIISARLPTKKQCDTFGILFGESEQRSPMATATERHRTIR